MTCLLAEFGPAFRIEADAAGRIQIFNRDGSDVALPGDDMKVYLGDAVYADRDDFGAFELTTSDGMSNTNTIVLELEVFEALLAFALTPEGYRALRDAATQPPAPTEPPELYQPTHCKHCGATRGGQS